MLNVTKLPFDLTGRLASNLRSGEIRKLTRIQGKTNRMTCPEFGAYYTESLEVRAVDGTLLKRDVDYVTTYYYPEIGELTAKEACAIIVITNPSVGDEIRLKYQAVGGIYSLSVVEMATILNYTNNLPDKLRWEDIIDKPLQFVPADHTHEYWQLYGLESTNENLIILGHAFSTGNKAIIQNNREYYLGYIQLAQDEVLRYTAAVNRHIQDTTNPHKTDKQKIGLGLLNNWPMATVDEIVAHTAEDKYLPIGGIFHLLQATAVPTLTAHIQNTNNPHQVKLTDPLLNLWSTAEIQGLLNGKLALTQTAADSSALGLQSLDAITARVKTNLAAANVHPATFFTQDKIAAGPFGDINAMALVGNNNYRTFVELFASTGAAANGGIYFVGSNGNYNSIQGALDAIQAYSWVPVNTWVIGAYSYLWFGPGRVPVYTPFLVVCRRDPTDPTGFRRYL